MTQPSATNERQIERRQKTALSQRKADIFAIRDLMKSVHGRRFIWGLLSRSGINTPDNTLDPYSAVRNNGKREEGFYILGLCSAHTPNEYIRMLAENSTNQDLEVQEENNDDGRDSDFDPDAIH